MHLQQQHGKGVLVISRPEWMNAMLDDHGNVSINGMPVVLIEIDGMRASHVSQKSPEQCQLALTLCSRGRIGLHAGETQDCSQYKTYTQPATRLWLQLWETPERLRGGTQQDDLVYFVLKEQTKAGLLRPFPHSVSPPVLPDTSASEWLQ